MLNSLECGTVLEAAHCILLAASDSHSSSDSNSYSDAAINVTKLSNTFSLEKAYMMLLDREESSFSHENIIKDICAVMSQLRDKYSVCAKLIEHTSKLQESMQEHKTRFNLL